MAAAKTKKPDDRFAVNIQASFTNEATGSVTSFVYRMENVSWADMLEMQKGMVGQIDAQIGAAKQRHT